MYVYICVYRHKCLLVFLSDADQKERREVITDQLAALLEEAQSVRTWQMLALGQRKMGKFTVGQAPHPQPTPTPLLPCPSCPPLRSPPPNRPLPPIRCLSACYRFNYVRLSVSRVLSLIMDLSLVLCERGSKRWMCELLRVDYRIRIRVMNSAEVFLCL